MTYSTKKKIWICSSIALVLLVLLGSPIVHEYEIEFGRTVIQARRAIGTSHLPQGIHCPRVEYFGPVYGYQLQFRLGPVGFWYDFIKTE